MGGVPNKSGILSCKNLMILLFGVVCIYFGMCCGLFLRDSTLSSSRMLRLTFSSKNEDEQEEEKKAKIRAELGHGSWTLLHRMAAGFEKSPTEEQSRDIIDFFHLLSKYYPCPDCAKHFRELILANPVDAKDNRHLSLWLCKVHNEVNSRLGKPAFSCRLEDIAEKWGSCGCFGNLTKESRFSDS